MKKNSNKEKSDTITAKKTPRIPKLPKTRLVELFIRSGIPFLNCPENEIVTKGIALLEDIRVSNASNESFSFWEPAKEANTWNTNKAAEKLFLETRVLIKELVNRAVNAVPIPENDDLLDKVKKALKPLSNTFSTIKDEKGGWIPLTIWQLPKLKKYSGEKYEENEYTQIIINDRGAEAIIVAFTIETFRGFKNPINKRLSSFGKDWVGICPKCSKSFEKKQSNAEYCSKYCMNEVFRTTKHK